MHSWRLQRNSKGKILNISTQSAGLDNSEELQAFFSESEVMELVLPAEYFGHMQFFLDRVPVVF
jgi:hypothetical protein